MNRTLNFTDFSPVTFASMVETLRVKTSGKKPFKIPKAIAKLVLGNDLYRVFTDSYKVKKGSAIESWNPHFESFSHWLTRI